MKENTEIYRKVKMAGIVTNKEHLDNGIKSGFSYCCISWFFIRREILGYVLADFITVNVKNQSHIFCPFCAIFHSLFKLKLFYSYCKTCDWMQYKAHKCNKCDEVPENPKLRPVIKIVNKEMFIVGYDENLDKNIEELNSTRIVSVSNKV